MLRTLIVVALSIGLAASAAGQQAKGGSAKDPAKANGAAAGTNSPGGGSTPGTSFSGSGPSLQSSIPSTAAPPLPVLPQTPVIAAPSASPMIAARPIGAGGGCSRKSVPDCGVEASNCLIASSLTGNHSVEAPATQPWIRQTSSRTDEQAAKAGECANELRQCLQPSC